MTSIDETFLDRTGRSEDLESSAEFREGESIRVTEPSDSDTFEDTVTSELVEDEGSVDRGRGFVQVGDDTSDEVRLSFGELLKEDGELFLVTLTDRAESTFSNPSTRSSE